MCCSQWPCRDNPWHSGVGQIGNTTSFHVSPESKAEDADSSLPHAGEQAEVPKHSLPQIQVKKDGTYRSEGNTTDASAEDPGEEGHGYLAVEKP